MRLMLCGLLFATSGVLISIESWGQNYFIEQALLFSRQGAGGSARIQAMGGAQVALGGDFSSALSNPAGLGMYNRNEFTITPAFSFQNANSTYTTFNVDPITRELTPIATNSTASNFNVSLPGLSIVFGANKNDEKAPFMGGTFAITLNRTNDFNGGFEYEGQNNSSSMIDYFLEVSNGFPKTQFDPQFDPNRRPPGQGDNVNTPAFLGFENYLMGPIGDANSTDYFTDVIGPIPFQQAGLPFQKEVVKTSGAQNQWNISYGANFIDKIFLGAGIGIASVRYSYDKTYTENFEGQVMAPPCNDCFNNFQLNESRSTTGSGINLTLGALFKPIDFLQFGISYVTPTAYQLNDAYTASMTSSWNNFDYYANPLAAPPPPNRPRPILNNVGPRRTIDDPVTYGLSVPSRFMFGTAIFIPKKGFISADVEMINYSRASTSNFSEQLYSVTIDADSEVNGPIRTRFKPVTNIRIGGEYRINKFRLRAGYNIMGDPYSRKPTDRINYSLINMSSISGGLGYRQAKFYLDMAVIHTQGDGYYVPYAVASPVSPFVNHSNSVTRIMFTVGFPF
jgi:hypothetical protein